MKVRLDLNNFFKVRMCVFACVYVSVHVCVGVYMCG